MLNDIAQIGDRIHIIFIDGEEKREREVCLNSRLAEIMGTNIIKAPMPIVNGKYVVLDSLRPYNLEFITKKGMFECHARIIRHFKEKAKFFAVFELTSELEKIQRREYYRLQCVFDIKYKRSMEGNIYEKDDKEKVRRVVYKVGDEEKELVYEKKQAPWHSAIVTNISGGGVRFNSREALRKGENVLLQMHLKFDDGEEEFEVPAKVIFSGEVQERSDIFEARVQFRDITHRERESIIRFVFDEERRIRRRKKGLV
ncbi:flagellar brake protein [[Clostridium] polysaccharolyticum]|uniref:C-di-GMP-binding flagellar brake protein YcgR, contains PilZNR and PilZ domains n=1 Tax=[Clostridium] polysaccharolyticum TaxID=29364 RepID=A0A1H9Y2Y5_9FIRM|nr:PilZ domain-containing protein [[Clostridium] polysaccharolyticum]SES63101.1 c-di-GMP-binding flagellar brake protein YcgR, contains PilZNR and PilZ domains [[Clostridium] polysaccharolyticum]